MRLLIVVSISLLLISCSESQQAGSSNSTANLTSGNSDLPSSAVSNTSGNLASSSAVEAESDIQEVIKYEPPPRVVIEYKPKFDANDPHAPIEVAVLDVMKEYDIDSHDTKGSWNRMKDVQIILPIVSVPAHPDQFSVERDSLGEEIIDRFHSIDEQSVDSVMDVEIGEYVSVQNNKKVLVQYAVAKSEEELAAADKVLEEKKAQMSMLVVAEYNHMSSIPDKWIDSEGNEFIPARGDALLDDVVGGAVGFRIKESDKAEAIQPMLRGRLVLNRLDGLPVKRVVPDSEWKQWSGLARELSNWGEAKISACQDKPKCKKAIDWLTAPEHLEGNAYEYSVAGKRKLRFIQGKSRAKKAVIEECKFNCANGTGNDELQINLWMYANADGTVQVLRSGNANLDSVVLVDHYCESQCGVGWTAQPWVISSKGQTYIVGQYSGGTLHGYLVLEVLPKELKYVGRFAWGS